MHLSPTVLPWLTEHFASQPSLPQHHPLYFANSLPLQTLFPQWPTDPLPPQELFLPCLLHLGFQDVNLSLNDLEINRIEILLSSLPWPAILSFIDLLFQIGTSDIQIRLSWETDYQHQGSLGFFALMLSSKVMRQVQHRRALFWKHNDVVRAQIEYMEIYELWQLKIMIKRIPTSCSQFSSIDRELADLERDGQFYISAVREEPIFPPNNNNVSFELYNYLIFCPTS